MGTYIGNIDYENGFYNFWPLAEMNGEEIELLSEERKKEILPKSYFQNLNLRYNPNSYDDQDYLEDFLYSHPLFIMEFSPEDLMENRDPKSNELRPTGYYTNGIQAIKSGMIRRLEEAGIYQIYPSSYEQFARNSLTFPEDFSGSEDQKIFIDLGDFVAGPYTILYREIDDSLYIRTQVVDGNYLVSGYPRDELKIYELNDEEYIYPKIKKVRCDLISDRDLIHQYMKALGEELASSDHHFKRYKQQYSCKVNSHFFEARVNRLKELCKTDPEFLENEKKKEEALRNQNYETTYSDQKGQKSKKEKKDQFKPNPFEKLKELELSHYVDKTSASHPKSEQKKPEKAAGKTVAELRSAPAAFLEGFHQTSLDETVRAPEPVRPADPEEALSLCAELLEAFHSRRPEYSDEFILAYLISLAQNRITLINGSAGTGKTSLMLMTGTILGTKGAYIPVHRTMKTHEELYAAIPDQIEELRMEYRTDASRKRLYLLLLDNAFDASPEYYLTDMINENGEIYLDAKTHFPIADNLRCILSACSDFYNQTPSPRILDKAFVFTLPEECQSLTPDVLDRPEACLSYQSFTEIFGGGEIAPLTVTEERIYQRIVDCLHSQCIYVSPRKQKNILRFMSTARRLFPGKNPGMDALDYAVACQLLPMINGNGNIYRHWLEKLGETVKDLPVSSAMVESILFKGKHRLGSYSYFGRVY